MKKTLLTAAMLLAVSLNALAQADDIAVYNRGVEAFRAKDYAAARQHWGKLVAQPYAEAYTTSVSCCITAWAAKRTRCARWRCGGPPRK